MNKSIYLLCEINILDLDAYSVNPTKTSTLKEQTSHIIVHILVRQNGFIFILFTYVRKVLIVEFNKLKLADTDIPKMFVAFNIKIKHMGLNKYVLSLLEISLD